MENNKVLRLDITQLNSCPLVEKTWDEVFQELHSFHVQIVFGSTESFLNASPELQTSLRSKLNIPSSFFDKTHLQSNGFSGCDVWLEEKGEIKTYTSWSRFATKQTYDKLKPKRTFTPHVSSHQFNPEDWKADIAIHGPHSIRYGWEWYEMGFFTYWDPSGMTTILCFDLPTKLHSEIQLGFSTQSIDRSCPYAAFSIVTGALLRLYDDSVWSLRNHISRWEARRSQETDYFLLHELARHGIHVSETLNVAIRSLHAIRQHQETFRRNTNHLRGSNEQRPWDKVGGQFEFQLRFLQGLLDRSEANNARIQNEITLAFNVAAQGDSKIQVRIGHEAKREASAMKAIAVVTMAFLPATFVSTLFGMNFFSFQPGEVNTKASFTVSRQFWIYWAFSVPLTVATLALWIWWSRLAKRLDTSSAKSIAVRGL